MKSRVALALILPAGVLFLLSFAVPMVIVGRLSFFRSDYVTEVFVGLANYTVLPADRFFVKSFANAFVLVGMITAPSIVASYLVASALSDYGEKIQAIGRFVVYVPGLASGLIMGLLWKWLLNRAGLINQVTALLGIAAVPWLTEVWPARLSLALIVMTGGLGGMVIMFSASMHTLPTELRDAAMIDGASRRQYKRHIVLPQMMPTIFLMVLLAVVGMMQVFETTYVLWENGGPEGAIASPVYEVFMTAFWFGKQGLAAAKGLVLMVVIAAIMVVKQRIERGMSR